MMSISCSKYYVDEKLAHTLKTLLLKTIYPDIAIYFCEECAKVGKLETGIITIISSS